MIDMTVIVADTSWVSGMHCTANWRLIFHATNEWRYAFHSTNHIPNLNHWIVTFCEEYIKVYMRYKKRKSFSYFILS